MEEDIEYDDTKYHATDCNGVYQFLKDNSFKDLEPDIAKIINDNFWDLI